MPKRQLAVEYPPANEQQHIDSLILRLRAKMQRDYTNTKTLRDAHPKMHGCVRGEFSIAPHSPDQASECSGNAELSRYGFVFQIKKRQCRPQI